MGKRVKVSRPKAPTLNWAKLQHPSQGQTLGFAVGIPLVLWLVILVLVAFLAPKAQLAKALGFVFAWPIVSVLLVRIVANHHRSTINSKHRRGKVAGTAYPEVRDMLVSLCRLLDIKSIPDAYVIESDTAAATVRGFGKPYLMLSTRLQKLLSDTDKRALYAILLGHVKAGTVGWRTFITTALELHPVLKLLALPALAVALLGRPYLEDSQLTADRIALVVLDGDQKALLSTLVRVISATTPGLDTEQAERIIGFLGKRVEATADDVNTAYLWSQMLQKVPGLQERRDNIAQSGQDAKFQEQLNIYRQRQEFLASTA